MGRGLEGGAAACTLPAHLGLACGDRGPGAGMREKILTRKLVIPRFGLFEIGSQFLSAQARALLEGDVMLLEQSEIGSDHHTDGRLTIGYAIELVRPCVLPLIEPHVPQCHDSPVRAVYSHAAGMRYRPLPKNHSPTLDGSSG